MFVAQLGKPPAALEALEREAVRKVAPGPGHWCQPEDHHGRSYGLTAHVRPLRATCEAAMARAGLWEYHIHGGIPWQQLRHTFCHHRQRNRAALWREWLDHQIPTVVANHL
jgi:hypothetical protein